MFSSITRLSFISFLLAVSPFTSTVICAPVKAPLVFEENRGQDNPSALFTARAEGARVFLTRQGAVFVVGAGERRSSVRVSFPGFSSSATVAGEGQTAGISSYLHRSDPRRWAGGIRHFQAVRAKDVKQGVDILYYGFGRNFEYDVILHPNADAGDLRFQFDGAQHLSVDNEGDLVITTATGRMIQHRPKVWQQNGAIQSEILATYRLQESNVVALQLGAYDHSVDLVVDPVVSFATYLGGKGEDAINAMTLDASGNIYVTGFTASVDFPTSIGAYRVALNAVNNDAFVTKLNPTGSSILYSTYIGGSAADSANAIQVDSSGNAYIGGTTQSTDFPTTVGSYQPAANGSHIFLSKLNPTGTALVFSTYLGSNNYSDTLNGIAVDSSGSLYAVGSTDGSIPTTPGAYSTSVNAGTSTRLTDAFILKLSPAGDKLAYSTYLGGTFTDTAQAVKLDSGNQAYVIGTTFSNNFPISSAAFQQSIPPYTGTYPYGFVTCVNAAGSGLTYSTFLTGSSGATPIALFLDAQQNAYISGQTTSTDFPTTAGAFSTTLPGGTDVFLSKLNRTGSSLIYSTFLGGSGYDVVSALGVDANGAATVTGNTTSTNFPYTSGSFPAVQKLGQNSSVSFLTKLNADGTSIVYSTQIGSGTYTATKGIALDASGNAVVAGYTTSKTLPTTSGVVQTSSPDTLVNPAYGNGFVEKIDLNSTTVCSLSVSASSIAAPLVGASGTITVTVNSGCPWDANTISTDGYSASFVTLGASSFGIGSGSFTYTIPANYQSSSSRSAYIKVGSSTINVSQAPGSCTTPGITPATQNLDANGGLNSVSIQLPYGCYFTPTTTAPWIQLSSTAVVNGTTSLSYFVTRNDYGTRGGYINVSGNLFPVVQNGSNCTASLSSTVAYIGGSGGTGVVPFTVSPTSCQWTALSYVPWIQINAASGTGSGYDGFTVSPNPGSGTRSGQILIAGQLFSITQSGGGTAVPASYNVTTIAGLGGVYNTGSFGGDGGSGLGASSNSPFSVVYDASGNLFIGDTNNHRIRKLDTTGNISTVAGNGSGTDTGDGGQALSASVDYPKFLTFDSSGSLSFATGTYRIRTISSSGTISTVAGNGSFASPGDNSPALGAIPVAKGLASDPSGALYISDNIRIRKISGGILSYYAGTGNSGYNGDGLTPSATQLDNPSALASDAFGNLYFIDGYRIRKISGGTVSTIGGNQHSD